MASTCSSSETSVVTAVAEPPAAVISATADAAWSATTSATTTLAPSAAKSAAATRPMPLPAPVITATLPSRRAIEASIQCAVGFRPEAIGPDRGERSYRSLANLIGAPRRRWDTGDHDADRPPPPDRAVHVPPGDQVVVLGPRRRPGARRLPRSGGGRRRPTGAGPAGERCRRCRHRGVLAACGRRVPGRARRVALGPRRPGPHRRGRPRRQVVRAGPRPPERGHQLPARRARARAAVGGTGEGPSGAGHLQGRPAAQRPPRR